MLLSILAGAGLFIAGAAIASSDSPKAINRNTCVSCNGTARVVSERYIGGGRKKVIYKCRDCGRTWSKII